MAGSWKAGCEQWTQATPAFGQRKINGLDSRYRLFMYPLVTLQIFLNDL
ncbi:hypothetical protein CF161_16836 [Pseudomonas sp. CF161]|nr:hypothetical protein CF161_16836 [Pseudomonas sp. CF161]